MTRAFLLTLGKSYFQNYAGLPSLCWRGIFLNFFESFLVGIFYFFSIYFVNVLHLNLATTGSIISCYGMGAIAGGFIGGRLSDKFSASFVLACSLLIQSLGYFALIKLQNTTLISLDVFILGIAAYSFITSNYLCVLNSSIGKDGQKLKAINLLSTASNLGLALSAIVIAMMIPYGFKNIFLISGSILSLLSLYLFLQEKKRLMSGNIEVQTTSQNDLILSPKVVNKSNLSVMWFILFSTLFIGAIVSQRSTTYSIYIQTAFPDLGVKAISILFTLNTLMVVILEVPIGNYFREYNKILLVGIGGFLIGIGMLLLSFSYFFMIACIACIIYTLGEILFFCMAQYVAYQKGDYQKRGHRMGIYRTFYAASRVIGPFVGGRLYHHLGADVVWFVSGWIGLCCLTACVYFKKYD